MLTLYVKTGCPFCEKVLGELDVLEIKDVEFKNIAEEGVAEELIERGGKRQTPYLVDSDHDVEMYESDDIIDYLNETYGKKV